MEQVGEDQWLLCQLCKSISRRDSRQWLRPCPCPEPFHRQCLQYWVWTCEAQCPPKAPSCPWCGALYRIEPSKGPVITALDTVAHSWYPKLSHAVVLIACQVVVDSASTTFGLIILFEVYGFHEAFELFMDMNALTAITLCHTLPLAAIVINYIPWEDYLLRNLRRCSSLPVVGAIMPQGGSKPQPNRRRSITSCGSVVGGLLLPTFAQITGHLLFRPESPVRRFLLGGTVFLVVRGICYMYYRQKTFMHRNNLDVANYVSPDQ